MQTTCDDTCPHRTTYYTRWCPVHDGVQRKSLEYLNLIQALMVIDVDRPGAKDRCWSWFCDGNGLRNDTFEFLFFPDEDDEVEEDVRADFQLLRERFDLLDQDGFTFEISW